MVRCAIISNVKSEHVERGVNKFLDQCREANHEIKEIHVSGDHYGGPVVTFFYDDGEKPKKTKTQKINED